MSYLLDQRQKYRNAIHKSDQAYRVPGHDRDPNIQKNLDEETKDISSQDKDKYMDEIINKGGPL